MAWYFVKDRDSFTFTQKIDMRFEVFMVMKIQVVFWVVTPCSEDGGIGPPKCWYLIRSLHGITTHKIMS